MECIWCEARLHASCIKMSEEQCILIGNASNNIVFFCSPCLQALPVAFQSYEGFSLVDERISTIEKSISESQTLALQGLKTELTTLQTITSNLATRIKDLCSQHTALQNQLQTASSSSELISCSSGPEPTKSAFDVADEIADRDRRKRNVIVYNLPEEPNRAADKAKFIEVCKAVSSNGISIEKLFRLGRKAQNRHRPLLVRFDSENDRQSILSAAPRLRLSDEFKQVYIVNDKTKVERERHKQVIIELKRRRSNGETNIFVRNGNIVSGRPHTEPMQQNSAVHTSTSSPITPVGNSNQSS